MRKAQRIYCIEGHHDWGNRAIEPTVEPMLQLLRSTGYWEDYVHRKCATANECYFYLEREWNRCRDGSILYFASHPGHRCRVCVRLRSRCQLARHHGAAFAGT